MVTGSLSRKITMGTLLYGAIQLRYPENEFSREAWFTVAIFDFFKDYDLSMVLEDTNDHVYRRKDYPIESEDMYRFQEFLPLELPKYTGSPSYDALRGAVLALSMKGMTEKDVRVLFWRDQ